MSALEETPFEEIPLDDGEVVAEDISETPIVHPGGPFNSETAGKMTEERDRQRNRRKQSMGARIREMVAHDPARLANLLFDIAENVSGKERSADRIKATTELMDRGWGKAPTFMPIEGADPLGASDLDQAIRDIADQLVARRAHPTLDAKMIRREIEEGVRPDPEAQ